VESNIGGGVGLETSRIVIPRDIVCPWGVFISTNFHPSFPSPLGTMHVTSQTLPDPQNVLEVGFEPWNTKPILLCSMQPFSLFLYRIELAVVRGERKHVLIYEISNSIPIPRNTARCVNLFLTTFRLCLSYTSPQTSCYTLVLFAILTPRVYYCALVLEVRVGLHTYTNTFHADMQSISLQHIGLLLLSIVLQEKQRTHHEFFSRYTQPGAKFTGSAKRHNTFNALDLAT
jgi:hypothetical protein